MAPTASDSAGATTEGSATLPAGPVNVRRDSSERAATSVSLKQQQQIDPRVKNDVCLGCGVIWCVRLRGDSVFLWALRT